MQLLSGVCDSDDIRFVYFCFIYFNIHIYLGSGKSFEERGNSQWNKLTELQKKKNYRSGKHCLVKHQLSKGIIISST